MTIPRALLAATGVLLSLGAAPVLAATPVAAIEHFNAATLDIMKNAKTLGIEGRAKRFEPAVR
jgi:hypothetical protein